MTKNTDLMAKIKAGRIDENATVAAVASEEENNDDPSKLLEVFEMQKCYVEKLGKEVFVFPNLVIQGHVITVIAMSGGGKTTLFFYVVAPRLAEQGLKVWYIDADSPASDHKRMKALADKHGIKLLNPDVNHGTTMDSLITTLREIANSQADLTDWVFIIDTLKKAADLMSKGSVKNFYQLARKLSNLGATVILLGHANKYRDKDGNLVFEGVGDIRSDSDELIYLERLKNANGGIDVSTVIDPDKGAKVRGIFHPFSFHVSESRDVTFYETPLPLIDHTATSKPKATEEELIETAKKYLFQVGKPVLQSQLVQQVADQTGTGTKRARTVLVQQAEFKDAPHHKGLPFVYSFGGRNAHYYELPSRVET